MPGFLYFLESGKTIETAGLTYALDPNATVSRETTAGPGARGGIVVAHKGTEAGNVRYDPTGQTWRKISDGVYLGFDPANRPGPADLQRDEIIRGYPVTLADGNDWIIPLARIFPDGMAAKALPNGAIPQALGLDDEGKLTKKPLAEFAEICEFAERIWDIVRADAGLLDEGETVAPLEDAEAWKIAVKALGVNYRVGGREVSALELLTTANVMALLQTFVDFPSFAAVQAARIEAASKKNDVDIPAGGNT